MSYERRTTSFLLVGLIAIFQSAIALLLSTFHIFQGLEIVIPEPAAWMMQVVSSFLLFLGISGLIVIPALLLFRVWGYWGSLAMSVLTVAFDLWATFAVTPTAFVGLFVPIGLLAFLLPKRREFLHHLI